MWRRQFFFPQLRLLKGQPFCLPCSPARSLARSKAPCSRSERGKERCCGTKSLLVQPQGPKDENRTSSGVFFFYRICKPSLSGDLLASLFGKGGFKIPPPKPVRRGTTHAMRIHKHSGCFLASYTAFLSCSFHSCEPSPWLLASCLHTYIMFSIRD